MYNTIFHSQSKLSAQEPSIEETEAQVRKTSMKAFYNLFSFVASIMLILSKADLLKFAALTN